LVGRSGWDAPGPHADRRLVVGLYHRHGGHLQLCIALADPLSLRHGGGGGLAVGGPDLLALDPPPRETARARDLFLGCASGRRTDATLGDELDVVLRLAGDLCPVWDGGAGLGGRLVSLVPRRSVRASPGQRRRTPADCRGAPARRRPRRRLG